MILYNFSVLSSLLSSLSSLIKTNVSIFDEYEHSSDARSQKIYPFCSKLKEHIRNKCAISDKEAIEKIKKIDGPLHYYCHFGLVEMIMKYSVDANSSFYILIGPFRDPSKIKENINLINQFCETFHKDSKALIKQYKQIPRFSMEKYESIREMINVIIDYAKTTKLISSKDDFLENELNPYLDKNISKNIKINMVCKELFLTPKQLERLVKIYSGFTPKKYILKYKIDKAYNDIKYTNKPLQQIAFCYGFDDYNYFVRVFKKVKGVVPSFVKKQS